MTTGTPKTKVAAVGVLGKVGKAGTVANMIVKGKTADGTPAVGESPAIVDALLEAEGIGLQSNRE